MAEVRYQGVTRRYAGRDGDPAVDKLNMDIEDGEFMVLVGPSGSGKTTALRMLAGLEPIDGGQVYIGDRDVTHVSPKDRDIAMVFQNYALYPQKTVGENMSFALKMQGVPKDERAKRVMEAATMLGLGDLVDCKPGALSGGQRQRVAMGRAIVRRPKVFLMGEPLSNLDAKLRVQTRAQIAELQRRLGVTTVYVTHDQVEAMTMGRRVGVLNFGHLQQCDTPRNLYENPANLFVAGFIGSPAMNLRTVPVDRGSVNLGGQRIQLPDRLAKAVSGRSEVVVGVRPECLTVVEAPSDPDAEGDGRILVGEVVVLEELGADAFVHVRVGTENAPLVVRTGGKFPPQIATRVGIAVSTEELFAFAPDTGERLG
jgi:multiple sugar transport system ATP-binding protein